jgi:hypothetical protein
MSLDLKKSYKFWYSQKFPKLILKLGLTKRLRKIFRKGM